ncbi:helicase PIF1 [Seminavis robusta]|uniref:ATP-dependent DNA helicase n=1 Tax=Seminavis robusta TaxID=568900 RepID=A0A9N8E9T3_9STRA|nr:helicase PIF1 [Seminavis robusta]|eukprot:Sro783_g201870.1 helicase PIF1 (2661) ;mRNA; f:11106-19186
MEQNNGGIPTQAALPEPDEETVIKNQHNTTNVDDVQKQQLLASRRERYRTKLQSESPEKRAARLAKRREQYQLKKTQQRKEESPEHREARLARRRATYHLNKQQSPEDHATKLAARRAKRNLADEHEQHCAQLSKRRRAHKEQKQTRQYEIDRSRLTFDTPHNCDTINGNAYAFHDFEMNPETSALLYHLNSGHQKFRTIDDILAYLSRNQGFQPVETPLELREMMDKLKAEIADEMLTEQEQEDIVEKFLLHQGRASCKPNGSNAESELANFPGIGQSVDAHHFVCGSCGIKSVNGQYGKVCSTVDLADLVDTPVAFTEEQLKRYERSAKEPPVLLPTDDEGSTKLFYPHRLQSAYTSPSLASTFHLHPEFVTFQTRPSKDGDKTEQHETVIFCSSCTAWLNDHRTRCAATPSLPPVHSIAAGVDFGDINRIGLAKPDLLESLVIARMRHFHNVVKVQDNHAVGGRSDLTKNEIRGHSILFRHDSPVTASLALMFGDGKSFDPEKTGANITTFLQELVTIELVGPAGSIEKLARKARMQTFLQLRPFVLYQWLTVLRSCHPLYKYDPPLPPLHEFGDMKKTIAYCNRALMEAGIPVTTERALAAEQIYADDVAGIRTKILTDSDVQLERSDDGNPDRDEHKTGACSIPVAYTYVAQHPDVIALEQHTAPGKQEENQVHSNSNNTLSTQIEAIADAFNIEYNPPSASQSDCTTDADTTSVNGGEDLSTWKSYRDETPVNEFSDMLELLTSSFPQIFLLGNGYSQEGGLLTSIQIEHLLKQYTQAAATNRDFLFYLFDCHIRHTIMRNFAAKIRKDPAAFEQYATLLRDEEFQQKILQAAENPSSPEAKQVLRTVLPVLSLGGRNTIMAGALGDTSSLSRAMAMAKRYGPVANMVTVTPDDINNPTSFRWACRSSNNFSFPAVVDEDFFESLQKNGTLRTNGNVDVPLNYSSRMKKATDNPVAVALEFRTLLENVMSILIGCPLNFEPGTRSGQRRTWYFKSEAANCPYHRGIFGHVVAFFGTVETQSRGALHFHVILWGSISPKLLEKSAGLPDICKQIQLALDSMYTAELPRHIHAKDIIVRAMKKSQSGRDCLPPYAKRYTSMKHVPSPKSTDDWKKFMWEATLRNGIHEHGWSCRKPPSGKYRCRNAKGSGDSSATLPKLLEVPTDIEQCSTFSPANNTALKDIVPTISQSPIPVQNDHMQRDYTVHPIPPLDDALVVWELQRQKLYAMPNLPDDIREAYVRSTTSSNPPHETPPLSNAEGDPINDNCLLNDGRAFCIKALLEALEEPHSPLKATIIIGNGEPSNNEHSQIDVPSIQKWLETLDATTIIFLFDKLSSEISGRNGFVTETNVTLCNSTGGSTNAILLGSTQMSAGALFYVVPYVCKNKVALEACLVALEAAQRHIEQFPSSADDSGTDRRSIQHMFTRVLNDLSRSIQVSDTQVALSLLNMGTELTSDSFRFFGADYSVNYFLHQHPPILSPAKPTTNESSSPTTNNATTDHGAHCENLLPPEATAANSHIPPDDASTHTTESGFSTEDECSFQFTHTQGYSDSHTMDVQVALHAMSQCTNKSFGPAPFYTVGDHDPPDNSSDENSTRTSNSTHRLPVQYPLHWYFRGNGLKHLTNSEYYALVDIRPISSEKISHRTLNDDVDSDSDNDSATHTVMNDFKSDDSNTVLSTKRGRKQRKPFRFHPHHPLYHSHVQLLRAKQHTLIYNAHPPKFPGEPPSPPDADASPFECETFLEDYAIWRKAADAFASWYDITFLPHEDIYGDMPASAHSAPTWESFCAKIQDMEINNRLIDRLRLDAMFTFSYGFRSNYKQRVLFSNFRHRNTTVWSDQERHEAEKLFAAVGARNRAFLDDTDTDDIINGRLSTEAFSTSKIRSYQQDRDFCKHQMTSVKYLFPSSIGTNTCHNTITQHDASTYNTNDPNIGSPVNHDHILKFESNNGLKIMETVAALQTSSLDEPERSIHSNISHRRSSRKRARNGTFLSLTSEVKRYIDMRLLSDSQKRIVDSATDYFFKLKAHRDNWPDTDFLQTMYSLKQTKPPMFLLTGDPGTGKSYVIETLVEICNILQLGTVATTSYTGIAAVNIDGSTICSMFAIHDTSDSIKAKTLSDDSIAQLRLKLRSDNLCCLILDEISTIDSRIIALLDLRLRQILDNSDIPFGGLPIICVGDFQQLGPVQKTPLCKDMLTWAARTHRSTTDHNKNSIPSTATQTSLKVPSLRRQQQLLRKFMSQRAANNSSANKKTKDQANRFHPGSLPFHGCSLFAQFERFHLTTQQRASNDDQHKDFVQKLSTGNKILLGDILQYDHLSRDDIRKNPHEWLFCPVLVATNMERLNISRHKASLWAKHHQTFVFKWKCRVRKEVNRPPSSQMASIRESNSFFWQYWVPHAPCHLSHNINCDLALVNGSPVTAHSLTFSNQEEFSRVQDLLLGPHPPPYGSEITIQEPLSVNMLINPSLDSKPISTKRQQQLDRLKSFSLLPTNSSTNDNIVIPLTPSIASSKRSDYSRFTYETGNPFTSIGTAEIRPPFAFDLAFSFTVHKAQGRTLHRVVLDLTNHPTHYSQLEFAAVFVAMSRVKDKRHIRLLCHRSLGSPFSPSAAYDYLTQLVPDRNASAFNHGFLPPSKPSRSTRSAANQGVFWDPSRALAFSREFA